MELTFKLSLNDFLMYSQLNRYNLARYSVTRCPDPSPSSTDISVAERRFGFGLVVGFTLAGFDWEGVVVLKY